MNLFLTLIIFVGLILMIAYLAKTKKRSNAADTPWPYYAKKPLTNPEQVLYHRLVAAMPECIVLAQVQLSRILGVKKGHKFHEWNNRINRMSVDFVVCLKDSTVVAAVELDDGTHSKSERVEADAKKDRALKAAGVPVIRWNVAALPDADTIRQAFA